MPAMLQTGELVDTFEMGDVQFVSFKIANCEATRVAIESIINSHRAYWAVVTNPFLQRTKEGGNEN